MDPYIYVEKANLVLMKDESVRDYEMALRKEVNEGLAHLKNPSPGGGVPNIWVQYLYADKAVIEVYDHMASKEKYWEVPYKRDAKGAFTLGKPVEVKERRTFVPVAVQKAVWSTAYVNKLPDSAFLHIEGGGKKDGEGKTAPRSLRHFPYKDDKGKIDIPHLRNAIAQMPKAKISGMTEPKLTALQEKARALLEKENEQRAGEMKQDKKKFLEDAGFEAIPSQLWAGVPV